MSLMAVVKFGYSLVVVTLLLMIWASLSRALELHVDTGHPPCLFQALCTCSKPAGDLGIVTCKDVPILRVPAAVNSSKVFTLHLEGNGIRDLEPQFFQATGLYRLAINKNPLEGVHEEAFYGLDNTLWELELSGDKLTAVPSRAIRYLQKLRLLNLSGNEITNVSGDNWRGLENTLQTLILADNSIANLPLDAFTGLPALETLDLSGNHLALIDPGVFRDGMYRLNKLYLQDNQLTFIPYEEISPLRQLRLLDLSNNVIRQVLPARPLQTTRLHLDTIRLDNNVIQTLLPNSFEYFDVLNTTSLDGNPIYEIREDAFRNAKIKSLSLRDCDLRSISPGAFAGLETSLHTLDLSENNLTLLSHTMLNKLDALRSLNLRENRVDINQLVSNQPSEYNLNVFNSFQYKLFMLDVSGVRSARMQMQDIRRMRSLRYLSVGKLLRPSLRAEDFLEFGVELEELRLSGSELLRIETSAFEHVRTIKALDISENNIEYIDPFAFAELHSLTTLKIANGLADTVRILPYEPLKALIELQNLDFSNNKLKNVPDTSFHFMYKLKTLNLQDNAIEHFSKGTLQGDIHKQLESISLSFNQIRQVEQHTFVELRELQQILLEDNLIDVLYRRAFAGLDNLKKIILKGNRIGGISEEAFQNLPALQELDISYNQLFTFQFSMFDQVGSATALKVNVSHNNIITLQDSNAPTFIASNFYSSQKVPPSLGTVSVNIRELDFSHNNVTYIAPYYFRHAELTLSELHLQHNQLRNVSRDVFGALLMLQYLDLSYNDILHVEYDAFKRVKNLQVLKLSHNRLVELPGELLHDMASLTLLDLSHNHLRVLADNLIPSPALERLDVSSNQIARVPTGLFSPEAAGNLVELDLSGNVIPAVSLSDLVQRYRDAPGEYWEEPDYSEEYTYHTARRDQSRVFHQKRQYPQNILFKSLAWLDLSNNHLVRVEGGAFAALPRLKWLDLSDNLPFSGDRGTNMFKGLEKRLTYLGLKNVSLISLPSMPLSRLLVLDLSYNNLPSLPPETTGNLTRLRVLDLSYNDFTTLPVAVHSLSELRWLSISGNPMSALMNTSLYGISPKLEYLDITRLSRVKIFELGLFAKMYALRTLKITAFANAREFNIPKMLTNNPALENLYVEVEDEGTNLGKEMNGQLPCKLSNITITGLALKFLSEYTLSGVHSKRLHLTITNTSLEEIDYGVFWRPGRVKNLTLDLRGNRLSRAPNPARHEWPGVPGALFLHDILLSGNPLYCDCGIGWVEAWERKRRQYLCSDERLCTSLSRDDTRLATCVGWDNRTLNDVLKRDLDCSWSKGFLSSPSLLIVLGMSALTLVYI